MVRARTIAEVESDLVALRAAAERAGTALACLFSTSDEFEADIVRARREQGAYGALPQPRPHRHHALRVLVLTLLLTLAFLLF